MNGIHGIAQAVANLEAWLETLRGPDGYGGPVVHWWQNCLSFTGAGLDWRYEGIILGYLNLYKTTAETRWLDKARRAGDDLVRGQLPTGNYRHSCFELNPYPGGTPGEMACDLALLHLAETLRAGHNPAWEIYLDTARRNLELYFVARLWDLQAQAFRDHPRIPGFVPNKAATLAQALLRLARITGDAAWAVTYALPTLEAVLAHQEQGGARDGAIAQYSREGQVVEKYFPYYIARCIPGLVAGYEWNHNERYLDAARRALAFVLRCRDADGGFPQVIYPGGRVNRYPQWIAAVGDILRVADLLDPYGEASDLAPTLDWLRQGQETTGGFRTARGFASQISQREPGARPDFRDLLPVAGWNSMAFGYLSGALPPGQSLPAARVEAGDTPCQVRNQRALWQEDDTMMRLQADNHILYQWRKGHPWASVVTPELMWK